MTADNGLHDPLLTLDRVAAHSGLTFTVNRPVKDDANPLMDRADRVATGTHHERISYVSCVHKDDAWHMVYPGAPDDGDWRSCYATSTDGETFTFPALDRYVYNSSTANNIMQTGVPHSIRWDEHLGKWLFVQESRDGTRGLYIYTGDHPSGPWTLVKYMSEGFGFQEGKEVVRRNDGRWVAYRVTGQATPGDRSISGWISQTTDVSGAWDYVGTFIPSGGVDSQRYGLGVHRVHDHYFGLVMKMDANAYRDPPDDYDTGGTMQLQLWASRDGMAWTLVDPEWLMFTGNEGDWDAYEVRIGNRIAEVGNEWQVYYMGSPAPRKISFSSNAAGRAILQRGRMGQAAGTGELTTDPFGMPRTPTLTVNADAVGGSLKVEVRDAAGVPIPGFTEADSDPITTDVYDAVPTWGGQPFTGTGAVSLRFILTNAKLHGYSIAGVPSARRPARLAGGVVSIGGVPARISAAY